jgi:DNA-binding NtrC family response regulator/tetratricopeptide (TPR) repeat protein
MPLSHQVADELFRAGRFVELVRRAVGTPQGAIHLPPSPLRILVAHALFYLGHLTTAREVVKSQQHTPGSQARAEIILGLVEKRTGDFKAAARHFQNAAHLSRESGSASTLAWAQLHVFRLLLEHEQYDVLAPRLRDLRQLVQSAGDPHVSVYLHDAVAAWECQIGHLREAERHLDIARSILHRFPNAWLEQMVETNASSVACVRLDLEGTRTRAVLAREFQDVTGHDLSGLSLRLNEAYAEIWTGKFRRAYERLQSVLQGTSLSASLAAFESLARIHVALNRLDDCEDVLKRVADLLGATDSTTLYPVRWMSVSRAKVLLRRGQFQKAILDVDQQLASAARLDDVPLLAALSLVKAQAMMLSGGHEYNFVKASEFGIATNQELQGQFHWVSGQVARSRNPILAVFLFGRATRLWRHHGNVWASTEACSEGQPAMNIADCEHGAPSVEHVRQHDLADHTKALLATDSITGIFDLTDSPLLLAAELRQLIATLNLDKFAHVEETKARRAAEKPTPGHYAIDLGTDRGRVFTLVYREADDPEKSIAIADIARITRAALDRERLRREEQARAAVWPANDDEDSGAIYVDEQMVSLVRAARRVAPVNVSVLITGETGTGKEVLARAIHAASTRAQSTFLPFNCSACPRDMVDAQLFGHRRGAFTGALEHAPGIIRSAAGGTLFLDEIGDAPLDVQPKLLRFLESGDIHPIGETLPVHVDVRVIAATNADLDTMVSAGRFREDLFYRLNIVRLHIPPLRERRVEIPVMAQRYLQQYAMEYEKGRLRLAEDTMEYLLLYKWPGNVRQLANEMRRLAALAEHDAVLMPEHLAPEIAASRRTVPPSERQIEPHEIVVRIDQPMAAAVEHLERTMVLHALKACNGRVEDTAQRLGLSRKGLYLKRQRFGLDVQDEVRSA